MYCRNCGKEIKEDASFCPYCGASVDNNGTGSNNWQQTNSNIQTEAPDYTYQGTSKKQSSNSNHRGPIIAGVLGVGAVIVFVIFFSVSSYQEEQEAEQERILAEQEAEQERILAEQEAEQERKLAEQEAEERSKLSEINVIAVQRAINIVDDFLYGNKIATVAWLEMNSAINSMEEAETEESVEITDNVKTCMKTLLNELGSSRVAEGETGDRSVILENRNKIAEYAGLE